jgi:hypothetical protein
MISRGWQPHPMLPMESIQSTPCTIARRAYGPDSTPAEIEAIKKRIFLFRERTLMLRELPVQSLFHLDLFEQRLNQVGGRMPHYDLLIDLTEAEFPSAVIRARLKKLFTGQKNLRRIGVFTGKNFLINTAASFVLGDLGKKFSIHKKIEQAFASLG